MNDKKTTEKSRKETMEESGWHQLEDQPGIYVSDKSCINLVANTLDAPDLTTEFEAWKQDREMQMQAGKLCSAQAKFQDELITCYQIGILENSTKSGQRCIVHATPEQRQEYLLRSPIL